MMKYTGENKVAAALDDLVSFIHMVSLQDDNRVTPALLTHSPTFKNALEALKNAEKEVA